MNGAAREAASRRLVERQDRILELWRTRTASSPPASDAAQALIRALARALEAPGSPAAVDDERRAEWLRVRAPAENLTLIDQLQEASLEVLESEQALTFADRMAMLRAFSALRCVAAESVETRRRELERAAVRSEERYLAAARAAGFAIWDWDVGTQRLEWSHNVEALLGHPIGALSTLGAWLEHVHPGDRERIGRSLRDAVEKGADRWSEMFQFLRRDGTYASVLGRAWISYDRAGNAARVIGGLIDVTEQRQLERRLEEALREAVRVRDDFLSIASHELRTPMTALRMQIQGLIKGPRFDSLDERVKTRLNGAERSIMRMIQLVNELLDVSRLNADHLELELDDVDLIEVIREVIERMQPDIRRSGSPLNLSAPEVVVGLWDRSRVDQIFSNLLANALKYGEGGPIDILVTADEERALLRVRDRGIGIAAAEQARIFERFERAASQRHYGGFGLGLWIVRRVLDRMGGAITVDSEPAKGATFEVRLPRRPPSARAPRANGPPGSPSAEARQ